VARDTAYIGHETICLARLASDTVSKTPLVPSFSAWLACPLLKLDVFKSCRTTSELAVETKKRLLAQAASVAMSFVLGTGNVIILACAPC